MTPPKPPPGRVRVAVLGQILGVSGETLRNWQKAGGPCITDGTCGVLEAVSAATFKSLSELYGEEALGVFRRTVTALPLEAELQPPGALTPLFVIHGIRDAATRTARSAAELSEACEHVEAALVVNLAPTIRETIRRFAGKDAITNRGWEEGRPIGGT